jgi:phenylacetate-CoA ligase
MLARALLRHVVLPAAERLTHTRFWSYYTQALRFDYYEARQRQALQTLRLSKVWNAALSSALHRQRLEATGLALEPIAASDALELLGQLPPVAKVEFRRHFPEGVITAQDRGDWRYVSTSGTTDRLTVVADFIKRDHNRSSELRALHIAMKADVAVDSIEIPPNACNVVCGLAEEGPPTFWRYLWYALRTKTVFTPEAISDLRGRFERQVVLRRSTLPPIEPAPPAQLADVLTAHLERIKALQPRLLRAFPLYLLWLADHLRATCGTLPGLRLVGPYGGLTSAQMTARITAGLGAPFANIYGTNELGTIAAACGRSPGMHVFEDIFLVEVFQHGHCAAAGQVGRLVVTDLTNTAMPLIRYEVGDVGRLHTAPCPCGRKTARVEILGRLQEVLDTTSGPLPPSAVADTFFADAATGNFRLEEAAPGSFEAAIVGSPGPAKPEVESWRERFAALYPKVHRLRARLVPFVRPESSGKYRFVHPLQKETPVL